MKNNYEGFKKATIERYFKSTKERFYQLELVEMIMIAMGNGQGTDDKCLTHATIGSTLDEIIGNSYTDLSDTEKDEIFNIFLEEVKTCRIGISYEENNQFLMKNNLKRRYFGETDLMLSQIENFTADIVSRKIKPHETSNFLINYVHQFYLIGDKFTIEDIFAEHWLKINEIPRIEIGQALAEHVRNESTGIKLLKAPSGHPSKRNGQNKYKVVSIY